VGKKAQR